MNNSTTEQSDNQSPDSSRPGTSPGRKLFAVYEAVVLKYPVLVLLLTLAGIGWLSTHIPSFKLDASADALVLEGDEALKYYRQVSKRYASEVFLLVTYRPEGDLFDDANLAILRQMQDELAALPGVSSVVSILDVPLLQSPPLSLEDIASAKALPTLSSEGIDKAQVKEEFSSSPIYKDLLTSPDGQTTALQINLQRDERYHTLQLQRDTLREQAAVSPLSPEQTEQLKTLSEDFRQYAVAASERQSALVETVRAVIEKYRQNAQIFLGGVPMIAADMVSFVKSDLVVFGSGIIIFIILMLSIIFRRLTWVVLPLATCVLTATFMLGLVTWLDWRMTVISSNFVALLLIITLSVTIHLVVRYRELLSSHPDWEQAQLVRETTFLMIKPCIYTTLTTIVAFASLVVSGIRPVIDFGWMMTIGVSVALLLSFIILPAGLLLVRKPKQVATGGSSVAMTLRFAAFTENHGRSILLVSASLAGLAIFGVSRLEVENRFIDYFHESTEIYQGMEVVDAQLGGTIPLEIIIDRDPEPTPDEDAGESLAEPQTSGPDQAATAVAASEFSEAKDDAFFDDYGEEGVDFEDSFDDFSDDFSDDAGGDDSVQVSAWFNRAGLSRIESAHDYLDSLDKTGKVLSLATSYKALKQMTNGIDDIQLTLIRRSVPDTINEILIDPYLKDDIGETRITVRVKETSRTLRRADLLAEVQDTLVNKLGFAPEQVHLTGMLVLYNNMLQSLYRSQILTLGAVFVAIVIMFVILFRSLALALLAIAPNILAAGIVLGGMGLTGIPLDIMTVTIAAISVGIGVDNTIHYVHRFKTEFARDHNYLATMYRCHGSIGKAMYYTSSTIILGFSILALSNFTPSIYFGLLTSTAMFAALMGALLLLPELLIAFKPLGPNCELDDGVDA